MDWGDALDVPSFYGRKEEVALLSQWVIEERCRVVSIEGMGGIGKSHGLRNEIKDEPCLIPLSIAPANLLQ